MAVGSATAIMAGAGLVSGMMQANAASDAASAQIGAARQANQLQADQFAQQRADQQPWREAGVKALGQMENPEFQKSFTMADFNADPGYAFRLQEGQKALARASAANGLFSSGTMKSLTNFNQGMASQEYQNAYNRFNEDRNTRFNRLASLAGVGQTANSQMAQAGQNYANQVGQNTMAMGNAQAAGRIGGANAITNAAGQGMNTWMQYQMMNRLAPQKPIPTGNSAGEGYDNFFNIA